MSIRDILQVDRWKENGAVGMPKYVGDAVAQVIRPALAAWEGEKIDLGGCTTGGIFMYVEYRLVPQEVYNVVVG